MPNPYSYGPLVTKPDMFFGREAELDTLCMRLRNMQSTSVVGLRRIGKSSLLNRLAQALPAKLGQNFVSLYTNLQDARCDTVNSFVSQVCRALNEKVGGILSTHNVTGMSSFSEAMDKLNRKGVRPVLCLDEFEEFAQRPKEFNDDFFEALRALGQHAKLAMVTASRTPLTGLIRSGGLTSPLPNIFSHIELGLLESEAAQALRRIPFEREGIALSVEDEALVKELAGRHPCFLQMACYHLYEAQSQSPSRRADVVRDSFNRDAKPRFEGLWKRLNPDQRAALKVVVGQAIHTTETEKQLKRLTYLGLVERTGGNWQIFSTAFAEHVRQHSIEEMPEETPAIEELIAPITPEPKEVKELSPSTIVQFLVFTGVAIVAVIVAALVGSLVPAQSFRPVLIVAALILLFALVGAGKVTGHDFIQWLSKLLGLGGS